MQQKFLKTTRVTIKGYVFNGKKHIYLKSLYEINFCHYLNFLLQHKAIQDWEYEPDTFWFENIKRGTNNYLPDFRVLENNGEFTYYEVKGYMDKKSATKIKRMAKYHPDIKLILVDKPVYEDIKKKRGIIKNWGHYLTEKPISV
ncbi:hypothetical protein KO02_12365 [Sphingobacterium sp. ML3W]|uniref:hypothetical protein n=1 Tax=Sphingobacterium sp. ML3W TaxID=1538644 RepID=UPI0004F65F10|nr:hypothetical protein [Sphingobacterium sp. ML3W]AIM37397.1 hypothetical protein KO02_12365 [Sphingobacterium sp. ML3W]